MKTCRCGKPVSTPHGKLCDSCRTKGYQLGGRISMTKLNYAKREAAKREERRTSTKTAAVTAKCPTCWKLHTVEIAPALVEKGKIPRLYCNDHTFNRIRREFV